MVAEVMNGLGLISFTARPLSRMQRGLIPGVLVQRGAICQIERMMSYVPQMAFLIITPLDRPLRC